MNNTAPSVIINQYLGTFSHMEIVVASYIISAVFLAFLVLWTLTQNHQQKKKYHTLEQLSYNRNTIKRTVPNE